MEQDKIQDNDLQDARLVETVSNVRSTPADLEQTPPWSRLRPGAVSAEHGAELVHGGDPPPPGYMCIITLLVETVYVLHDGG